MDVSFYFIKVIFHAVFQYIAAVHVAIIINKCMFSCVVVVMPRCACASEAYGSVFVCVCLFVQLLKDQ